MYDVYLLEIAVIKRGFFLHLSIMLAMSECGITIMVACYSQCEDAKFC